MKPLSHTHRLLYLLILGALFFTVFPLVLFYADGYRYDPELGLFKTGGIFVSVPYSGATLYLNGVSVGTSSLLTRSFYIDDLTPGIYTVRVSREGSRNWERALIVETQVVTDATALLLPEEVTVTRLVTGAESASSTRAITLAEARAYADAFDTRLPTTTPLSADSTVVVENGDVFVRWTSTGRLPESTFCRRPSFCTPEIGIETGEETAITVFPYGSGVVYVTDEGGVFFSEVDARSRAVVANLYAGEGVDARVVDNALIVMNGQQLYEISL